MKSLIIETTEKKCNNIKIQRRKSSFTINSFDDELINAARVYKKKNGWLEIFYSLSKKEKSINKLNNLLKNKMNIYFNQIDKVTSEVRSISIKVGNLCRALESNKISIAEFVKQMDPLIQSLQKSVKKIQMIFFTHCFFLLVRG